MNPVAVTGQVLALLASFYLPGLLALVALRLKVFPALALAPAASAAIAGAASMVCLATGWRWGPDSAAILALAAVGLCAVFGRIAGGLPVRRVAWRNLAGPADRAGPGGAGTLGAAGAGTDTRGSPATDPEADGVRGAGTDTDTDTDTDQHGGPGAGPGARGVREADTDEGPGAGPGAGGGPGGHEAPAVAPALKVLLGASLAAAAALIGTTMVRGMVSLDRVSQGWDATFHANAVRWIKDSGQSSPWSLVPIFGGGPPSFYPAGWHELVSLVPGDIVTAANLSCLLIGAIIWPASLAYLASALLPRLPAAWILAPLFGAAVLAFPFVQLVRACQWPNGFASAVIPAVLALGINLLYATRLSWRGRPETAGRPPAPGWGARTAALLLAAAGAVWIHPTALFALLVLGGLYLARFLVLGFLFQWRLGKMRAVAVTALSAAALAVAGFGLARLDVLIKVLDYPRSRIAGVRGSLAWLYFDLPNASPSALADRQDYGYAVAILMVAGAAAALAYPRARPAVGGMLAATGMFVLAAGPENPYRWLAGFWYKDPPRIAPLVFTCGCVFAALAVERLCRLPVLALRAGGERRRQVLAAVLGLAVVAGIFTASGGFRYETRLAAATAPYRITQTTRGRALLGHEQDFIRSLGPLLPPDSVVVGDPFNGLPYIYSLTGRRVVFPQLINSPATSDQAYLRGHFRNILTDPEVCRVLGRMKAGYVYDDGPARARQTDKNLQWPGFKHVDYSKGFELVAKQGTAALYKITACGGGAGTATAPRGL